MRSPLGRHSMQLSSSTVFMFSTQIASTGPSKRTCRRRRDERLDEKRAGSVRGALTPMRDASGRWVAVHAHGCMDAWTDA
eukprot:352906-Chlamydomonas_euryale.AAC.3